MAEKEHEISVMSYNICRYNNDESKDPGFPPEIMDRKITNLKQMLMEYGPDFVGLQEDTKYIDRACTKQARTALFTPVWRFVQGTTETTLRAKYGAVSGSFQLMRFSTGRFYAKVIFDYTPAKKKILFVSLHASAYTMNEPSRKKEYDELFNFIFQEKGWDHCIVTGDFNVNTSNDKALLTSLCDETGFNMAIGSYLPWIPTCFGHNGDQELSFDNILVSDKMEIKRTKVLYDWYSGLYSDHLPVICDVAL